MQSSLTRLTHSSQAHRRADGTGLLADVSPSACGCVGSGGERLQLLRLGEHEGGDLVVLDPQIGQDCPDRVLE